MPSSWRQKPTPSGLTQGTVKLRQARNVHLPCEGWHTKSHLLLFQSWQQDAPVAFFRSVFCKPEKSCVYGLRGVHEHNGVMNPRPAIQPQHRCCDVAADGAAANAGEADTI
jgi:hypothetical protein